MKSKIDQLKLAKEGFLTVLQDYAELLGKSTGDGVSGRSKENVAELISKTVSVLEQGLLLDRELLQELTEIGDEEALIAQLSIQTLRQAAHSLNGLLDGWDPRQQALLPAKVVLQSVAHSIGSVMDDLSLHEQLKSGTIEFKRFRFDPLRLFEETVKRSWLSLDASRVTLLLDYDAGIPATLIGDEDRLRHILITLLQSVVVTTEEGDVRVKVTWQSQEPLPFRLQILSPNLLSQAERIEEGSNGNKAGQTEGFGSFKPFDIGLIQKLVDCMGGRLKISSDHSRITELFCELSFESVEESVEPGCQVHLPPAMLFPEEDRVNSSVKLALKAFGFSAYELSTFEDYIRCLRSGPQPVVFVSESQWVEWVKFRNEWQSSVQKIPLYAVLVRFLQEQSPAEFASLEGFRDQLLHPVLPCDVLRVLENSGTEASSEEVGQSIESVSVDYCNLLVVEDDPIAAMVLQKLLEKLKCRVSLAESGKDALEKVKHETYELIFMDCVMPGMSGFEATERIRQSESFPIPIVAVTASTHPDTRMDCLRSGMNDVLTKPVGSDMLRATLERWLGRKVVTGLDRLQGLRETWQELGYPQDAAIQAIKVWLEGSSQWIEQARTAVEKGETGTLLEVAYAMRIGLSFLGVEQGYTEIRQMEERALQGKWSLLDAQLESVEMIQTELATSVEQLLVSQEGDSGLPVFPQNSIGLDAQNIRELAKVRLLLIDPHPMIQTLFRAIGSVGFDWVVCSDREDALAAVDLCGWDEIGCVLCSENRVGINPLSDCQYLLAQDPTVSVLVFAHFPSRELVNAALKVGVQDILTKPASLSTLTKSTVNAVKETERKRRLRVNQKAARRIGTAQMRLLSDSSGIQDSVETDLFIHPKWDAGGDFWVKLVPESGRHLFLMTDVSGHDVEAAFVSAYFHGLIRGRGSFSEKGMLNALEEFNTFLCKEWNAKTGRTDHTVEKSIVCCAVDLNRKRNTLEFYLCGCCLPLVFLKHSRPHFAALQTGVPLGWYEHMEVVSTIYENDAVAGFFVWSDGVETLASDLEVNPLSLARVLLDTKLKEEKPTWIEQTRDDLLVSFVRQKESDGNRSDSDRKCVFFETYNGSQSDEVDRIQKVFGKSLQLVMQGWTEEDLFGMQLCFREALLNALLHGCQKRPDLHAHVCVCLNLQKKSLEISVWDEGNCQEGNDFDFEKHAELEYRGMSVIRSFCREVSFHSPSKCVEMIFDLPLSHLQKRS